MADRVAAFALSLTKLSNDVLAMVDAAAWSAKLKLPPRFVLGMIADEMSRRKVWSKPE